MKGESAVDIDTALQLSDHGHARLDFHTVRHHSSVAMQLAFPFPTNISLNC